ncbi:glycosyltransferase [Fodinicola feengrottensis]|uniref:Glycosyltransferase n=1 Tax=Fodinicola feengrottensis TaxID=435914 RepID=A0ABN2HZQ1_9ACTN
MDPDWKLAETDRVTVVIATRNRRADLLRFLDSLVGRVPVVVVDNDSRDGTAAAVRTAFPSVRIAVLPRNRGAAARNVGVRLATTPYVAFGYLDSAWAAGTLAQAARIFDRQRALGLLAARTIGGSDPAASETAVRSLRPDSVPVLGFRGRAAFVRRDAFLAVGGFSSVSFSTNEAMLLSYDLAAAGWALAYVDTVVMHQRSSTRSARRRLELRNLLLISWMRRPLRRACADAFRLAHCATVSADACVAFGSALIRLPWALANRRRLPPQVESEILRLERETVAA